MARSRPWLLKHILRDSRRSPVRFLHSRPFSRFRITLRSSLSSSQKPSLFSHETLIFLLEKKAKMASISTLFYPNVFSYSTNHTKISTPVISSSSPAGLFSSRNPRASNSSISCSTSRRSKLVVSAAATAEAPVQASDTERRLYVGNIPRDVDNEKLANIFGEHGTVEKAEVSYFVHFDLFFKVGNPNLLLEGFNLRRKFQFLERRDWPFSICWVMQPINNWRKLVLDYI